MNKQKSTGKKLSRSQMLQLNGGSARAYPCTVTADCPNPCNDNKLKGNVCISGLCRYMVCA